MKLRKEGQIAMRQSLTPVPPWKVLMENLEVGRR